MLSCLVFPFMSLSERFYSHLTSGVPVALLGLWPCLRTFLSCHSLSCHCYCHCHFHCNCLKSFIDKWCASGGLAWLVAMFTRSLWPPRTLLLLSVYTYSCLWWVILMLLFRLPSITSWCGRLHFCIELIRIYALKFWCPGVILLWLIATCT